MFASSALFDEGTISNSGYTVSATRTLNQNYKITVAYGTLGVMTPEADLPIRDAESLREAMMAANRGAVTVRSEGLLKKTGTRYVASSSVVCGSRGGSADFVAIPRSPLPCGTRAEYCDPVTDSVFYLKIQTSWKATAENA